MSWRDLDRRNQVALALSTASRRWYTDTVELEDYHLKLLQAAAEAWDRL